MGYNTDNQEPDQDTVSGQLASVFLWPGEKVCDLLKVEDPDSRMLFRMFVNLSAYGKSR